MLSVERLEDLSPERKNALLKRSMASFPDTMEKTREILARLRRDPEGELKREYSPLKADLRPEDLVVSPMETSEAFRLTDPALKMALEKAAGNIETFHRRQLKDGAWFTEISPGLVCGRLTRPIESVGVYIPGGRAVYPSTALMNLIPARAAGVENLYAVSPPGEGLKLNPAVLVAAAMSGAKRVFKLGGAWAVGCLAYGLSVFPKVGKIVGPGSSWVTAAKAAVFGEVDIDLPAGPSEGFIIADAENDPETLAWDFLAQLEHDPQAAAILVATSQKLAERVLEKVSEKASGLKRAGIVQSSLANAAILVADSISAAFDFANLYAPEHLQILLKDPFTHLSSIKNAGSVFLGPYSPVPAGDYASGTNHVLPTGGAAAFFSGLSTDSFLKTTTFQCLTREALHDIAPAVLTLAEAEGLECHALAVKARLKES
ncbi:MAG: histidinol dehydrogenase [Deltaproteobacteria bacterium]|jgi:histidinol dehydrogenase|nr:histidinol dehydrogenase [Deltaproteobacteria bacterium]